MSEPFFTLLPLTLLTVTHFLVPSRLMGHAWVRWVVVAGLSLVVLRYLWWRIAITVLPANDLSAQSIFVWMIFLIEMLAWMDTSILLLMLMRQTDRRAEAGAHEARLRRMGPADLPTVDVFIATYNEPPSVLEKTIVGAAGLDWPAEKLRVWVLDDGRRDWLRDYAETKGIGYLRRDNNAHAKAGNINAALRRTDGSFVLVLDADFVPQQWFLYRTIGFFADPAIGIVQTPHHFFNHDPMQSALDLRLSLPDEQRLFFDIIMPARDGWDCGFCCGTNGVIRRAALDKAGGGLPTSSITEDILLTMVLLRHGYVTRYLGERLAVGLAPESLGAYFVQRTRWARGAIQALYLPEGPLGPGLRLIHRITFLPLHWISQTLIYTTAMLTPPVFLLTGMEPLLNASITTVLHYQVPAIIGAVMAMRLFAKSAFVPLVQAVHGVLQAFRLLPAVVGTLIRPHGHVFKVTPKGADAQRRLLDRPTAAFALGIMIATALGLALNSWPATRIIGSGALIPVVAFWAIINMFVLAVVASISMAPPPRRTEERFLLELPARIQSTKNILPAHTLDLSMTGAALQGDLGSVFPGDWVVVDVPDIGRIAAHVMRRISTPDGKHTLAVQFELPQGAARDALIRRLYTQGLDNSALPEAGLTMAILGRVLMPSKAWRSATPVKDSAPNWAKEMVASTIAFKTVSGSERDAFPLQD